MKLKYDIPLYSYDFRKDEIVKEMITIKRKADGRIKKEIIKSIVGIFVAVALFIAFIAMFILSCLNPNLWPWFSLIGIITAVAMIILREVTDIPDEVIDNEYERIFAKEIADSNETFERSKRIQELTLKYIQSLCDDIVANKSFKSIMELIYFSIYGKTVNEK